MTTFRVVQPWGPDKARQSTLQSEHDTVAEAFAALDAISAKMMRTGTPSNAIELVVVDENGRKVERPDNHLATDEDQSASVSLLQRISDHWQRNQTWPTMLHDSPSTRRRARSSQGPKGPCPAASGKPVGSCCMRGNTRARRASASGPPVQTSVVIHERMSWSLPK